MYAVNHRTPNGTAVHFVMSAEFGDLSVGQQHELFDELIWPPFAPLEIDAQGFAFGVEFELGFFALEAYGSALEACFAHPLGQTVERQHLFGEVALAGFDDLLRLLVGEAAVGEDDRAAEPFVQYFGFLVEREDRREAETLFVGAQRAKFVAQFFRAASESYDRPDRPTCRAPRLRCRAPSGVERSGHVGDMYAHLPYAVFDLADREGVVEVLASAGSMVKVVILRKSRRAA